MKSTNKVLVIGGSNIDFFGKTKGPLVLKDSNIGEIEISFGGVSRNITENLARLGVDVTFITSIGNTYLDKALKEELEELNVNVILREGNYKTSNYLAIHDSSKDMVLALCEQHVNDAITIDYIKSIKDIFANFKYVVLDTNLDEATIEYILSLCTDKVVFMDAISTKKVLRIKKHLNCIDYLKCNFDEARSLFDTNLKEEIFDKFPKTLIISDGANDILYSDCNLVKTCKVIPLGDEEIVNVTGAGDALLSGIIYGVINNYDLEKAIILGTKLANITIKSKSATSKENLKKLLVK